MASNYVALLQQAERCLKIRVFVLLTTWWDWIWSKRSGVTKLCEGDLTTQAPRWAFFTIFPQYLWVLGERRPLQRLPGDIPAQQHCTAEWCSAWGRSDGSLVWGRKLWVRCEWGIWHCLYMQGNYWRTGFSQTLLQMRKLLKHVSIFRLHVLGDSSGFIKMSVGGDHYQ